MFLEKFCLWLGEIAPFTRPVLSHHRVCRIWQGPLPSLPEYWDMLTSFDWVTYGAEWRGGYTPTDRWAAKYAPLLSRLERIAYRSVEHEEWIAKFMVSAERGSLPPPRPLC